jgi:glycosyltransferase involved in cell wall biosynthesis
MRLIILSDNYPPLRISGAVQMRDLVREFADQGHQPTVVTPVPCLKTPWEYEWDAGVRVLRVRTPPTKDVNYFIRTLNETRLTSALTRGMRRAGMSLSEWEGVVWYSPTIFLGRLAGKIRRNSNCRSYLILRDIFPEWAVDMGLMGRGLPYRYFKYVEFSQYSQADTVGVQTEANLPYLENWAKGTKHRLEVLENWLSPAPIRPCRINLSLTSLAGCKVFAYTGNMGVAQDLDLFIEMAVQFKSRDDVGFLFVGRGSEKIRLTAAAKRNQLDKVIFFDEIEPSEIPGLLSQCHVAMLALSPQHKSHNIPGKFLTYLQAGMPVLARINPGNDLEQLISKTKVGQVYTGNDPSVLANLAEQLLRPEYQCEQLRQRAREIWLTRFSTHNAVKQITQALDGRYVEGGAR